MVEDRSVVAVLEVGPYTALCITNCIEILRIWLGDSTTGYVRDKSGTEEDGEDAEVLSGVGNRDPLVSRAEGVLEVGAQIVR